MKQYTYNVVCAGQRMTCGSVAQATQFINSTMGVPLVSPHMVINYFVRPHLANKRLFVGVGGCQPFIQIQRGVKSSSSQKE